MTASTDTAEEATTTTAGAGPAAQGDPQDARAGARPERNPEAPSAPATRRPGLSYRTDRKVRNATGAVVRHPARWSVWEMHPASPRAVIRHGAETRMWDGGSSLARFGVRVVFGFLAVWAAWWSLVIVAPRNKTCWGVMAALLAAWLTIRLTH